MGKIGMFFIIITALCSGTVEAYIYVDFNDGGVHEINSGNPTGPDEIVRVDYGCPGVGTTVSLVSGGKIGRNLEVFENGNFTMSGGEIATVLCACGDNHITISGGKIWDGVFFSGSQVTISGGEIAYSADLEIYNSQVTLSGGVIGNDLRADGYSQVTISGGVIGYELWATQNSVVTINGRDFSIDGLSVGYGPITVESGILTGILSGTLASGETINNNFHIYEDATIMLVPEPGTVLLLGMGGFLALRKRRRLRDR